MTQQDNQQRKIWYYSTLRGVSNEDDEGQDRVYYGKIIRHPGGEIDDAAKKAEEGVMVEIENLVAGRHTSHSVEGAQFAAGEFVERYEIYDIETGDLVVMWRLPFKRKTH